MKKSTAIFLALILYFTSFLPFLQTSLTPQKAYAEESCIYYDPFGNWRAANGQVNIHMLFQSQQQDPESSLYYLRARYYDPFLGRFISRDPVKGVLTNPQSQNPYAYALNNPVNLSDPSGKFAQAALLNPYVFTGACVVGGVAYATNPSFRDSVNDLVITGISSIATLLSQPTTDSRNIDSKEPPDSDWIWRGSGQSGSDQGAWYNPSTDENIHPHTNSPKHGSHEDYTDPFGNKSRIYPDGRIEPK